MLVVLCVRLINSFCLLIMKEGIDDFKAYFASKLSTKGAL